MGLTQAGLAETLHIHHTTVSKWELEKVEFSHSNALAFEQAFRVSANWLLTGEGEMMLPAPNQDSALRNGIVSRVQQLFWKMLRHGTELTTANTVMNVPLLTAVPCTGNGDALKDYVGIQCVSFDVQWLSSSFDVPPRNLCVMQISSDSMAPIIMRGEFIFVDGYERQPEYRDGVWVLRLDDELTVKRVKMVAPNHYQTISEEDPSCATDLPKTAKLLGRVVGGPPRQY